MNVLVHAIRFTVGMLKFRDVLVLNLAMLMFISFVILSVGCLQVGFWYF